MLATWLGIFISEAFSYYFLCIWVTITDWAFLLPRILLFSLPRLYFLLGHPAYTSCLATDQSAFIETIQVTGFKTIVPQHHFPFQFYVCFLSWKIQFCFLFKCMSLPVWAYTCVCGYPQRLEEDIDLLELELQIAVSHLFTAEPSVQLFVIFLKPHKSI